MASFFKKASSGTLRSQKDGTFFESYFVEEKEKFIGEGSQGKVMIVRNKQWTGIPLACKQIDKRAAKKLQVGSKGEITLEDEVIALRSLQHPNIISYVDSVIEQTNIYIVMEYISGTPLTSKKGADIGVIRQYVFQILRALDHCNSKGVVHRDIKPDNIMVTYDVQDKPFLKLIDFGFSHKITRKVKKGEKGLRTGCGTLNYASPQILKREPYSFKTDIWSVGVVAFELICRRNPFEVNTKTKNKLRRHGYGEDNFKEMLSQEICEGKYSFDEEEVWMTVDDDVKALIRMMLVVPEAERSEVKDCMQSPWLKELYEEDQNRFKNNNTLRKKENVETLNRCTDALMAADAANTFQDISRSDRTQAPPRALELLIASQSSACSEFDI